MLLMRVGEIPYQRREFSSVGLSIDDSIHGWEKGKPEELPELLEMNCKEGTTCDFDVTNLFNVSDDNTLVIILYHDNDAIIPDVT